MYDLKSVGEAKSYCIEDTCALPVLFYYIRRMFWWDGRKRHQPYIHNGQVERSWSQLARQIKSRV